MRRLRKEGRLDGSTGVFFKDRKPEVELYDWEKDPEELNNLTSDPDSGELLKHFERLMNEYLETHTDLGLQELGRDDVESRKVPPGGAVAVREWLQEEHPERWERVTRDVFVKYQALVKEYNSRQK
jgi:hypothetical protein